MKNDRHQGVIGCREVRKKLIFLAEGSLGKNMEDRLLHHLETCSECTMHYQRMKSLFQELVKEKIKDSNPYFSMKVMDRLKNTTERSVTSRPSLIGVLKPVMVILMIAIAITAGILLGGSYSQKNRIVLNDYRSSELQAITDDYYLDDLEMENIERILITENNN